MPIGDLVEGTIPSLLHAFHPSFHEIPHHLLLPLTLAASVILQAGQHDIPIITFQVHLITPFLIISPKFERQDRTILQSSPQRRLVEYTPFLDSLGTFC